MVISLDATIAIDLKNAVIEEIKKLGHEVRGLRRTVPGRTLRLPGCCLSGCKGGCRRRGGPRHPHLRHRHWHGHFRQQR